MSVTSPVTSESIQRFVDSKPRIA